MSLISFPRVGPVFPTQAPSPPLFSPFPSSALEPPSPPSPPRPSPGYNAFRGGVGRPPAWRGEEPYHPGRQWARAYNDRLNSRRRDRPVEVMMRNGGLFHCTREDILYHFPNLNQFPIGRQFQPQHYLRGPNRSDEAHDALVAIFKGLENYRLTGTPLEIFERADHMLDVAMDGRAGFREAARFYCGVCQALDKELGLGCSDEILQQIDDFVVGLMENVDVETAQPRPEGAIIVRDIIFSYSRVFQPSTPEHMDTLRQLWALIPLHMKSRIYPDIIRSATEPPRTSAKAVFAKALRDMSCF